MTLTTILLSLPFLIIAWISSFNWLANNGFELDWSKDRVVYIVLYVFTPLVVAMLLVQGIVFKTLNFFCKER